jgi:orotidine-5'-phosphate decarboxylase
MYAKAFLSQMDFDSVTVAPYMGKDSVSPFFTQEGKWVILLALTSNPGAYDFQTVLTGDKKLYEEVIRLSSDWGTADNTMYVVGATKAEMLTSIRNLIPKHFLLVPGVGAQGGSLEEVAKFGMNAQCGLLVNASRSILYASSGTDFADKAQDEARSMQEEMARLLKKYRF